MCSGVCEEFLYAIPLTGIVSHLYLFHVGKFTVILSGHALGQASGDISHDDPESENRSLVFLPVFLSFYLFILHAVT